MNSHQRRKARRHYERQIDELIRLARERGYSSQSFAQAWLAKHTGPTIAELQRDGHLPTTNQERT